MRQLVMWSGLVVLAGAANAQVGGPGSTSDHAQVFIAPSGEPFRAPAGSPYPVVSWFAQADRNHDGKVDLGEFTTDFMHFFDRIDTDHDGILSAAEIKAYETAIAPEVSGEDWSGGFGGGRDGGGARPGGHSGGHGGGGHGGGGAGGGGMPGGGGGEESSGSDDASGPPSAAIGQSREIASDLGSEGMSGGARFGLIAIPEPVSAMDTSFSGHVSRADAMAAAQRRFGLLDPDQKGAIAWSDLPKTMAQQRGKRRR